MSETVRLGLTGSIGMGKTTTARMFAARGFPVWDADAAVDRLYAPGGAAVPVIEAVWPAAIRKGTVDRGALKRLIAADSSVLARLEAIVHPLVQADRKAFLDAAMAQGARLAVFDIPLLFETGAEAEMDAVAVVSAPAAIQRARVLARPGMTEEHFHLVLARQMSDAEKRARATFVIPTETIAGAERAVDEIVEALASRNA